VGAAADQGTSGSVGGLLAAKADPNFQVAAVLIGRLDLWVAAGQCKADSVKMLLAAWADPNFQVAAVVTGS